MSREIVNSMFHVIDWKSDEVAFIDCPGKHFHTGKNSKKDCRVNLDVPPTIFCLHSSCSAIIADMNYKFRRALWDNNPLPKREFTEGERAKIKQDMAQKKKEEEWRQDAIKNKATILQENKWLASDVFHESPMMGDDPMNDSKLFLETMFKADDIIWNGDVMDSGKPEHKDNFRAVKDFLTTGIKGNFTCGSTFKSGTISRSNDNVLSRPYLVVESDTLTIDETCSLYRWMKRFLQLKAIVHSGGKSAHGWFVYPKEKWLQKLKIILPELGCDPALFKPSQPVRMPGVMRGDKLQCLYWGNPT